jgi:phosphopantetheinyl transferase
MSASIAVARVENQGACRDALRQKCDQLLRKLARKMGADDAEPVTVRHISGSAPCLYWGEKACDLRASVAHSGPWVAVALAGQGSIGVDIQVRDDRRRYREIAEFLNLDPDAMRDKRLFFSSWTLREAIAKAADESMLTPHVLEPKLAVACQKHGQVVNAGPFSAFVDVILPNAHLAVVLNNDSEARTCA